MSEHVDAWIVEKNEKNSPERSTVHLKLEPTAPPTARSIEARVFERSRDHLGTDSYVGPCSMESLRKYELSKNALWLRGSSGPWRIAGHIDFTPVDGSRPYTKLFLERG